MATTAHLPSLDAGPIEADAVVRELEQQLWMVRAQLVERQ